MRTTRWNDDYLRAVFGGALNTFIDETDDMLFRYFRKTEDRAARNELIQRFSGYAERIAKQYARRGEPVEDLAQVAFLGLVKAVDRFDPDHGSDFLAYCSATINGELKRYFRDSTWRLHVPRRLQELHLQVRNVRAELTNTLGHAPTVSELANEVGVSEEDILEALEVEAAYRAESLDAPILSDGESASRIDLIGDVDPRYSALDQTELLKELVTALTDRDRKIIELRFFAEKSQTEIADEIGVSQMHVSRLLSRVLDYLRVQLHAADAE